MVLCSLFAASACCVEAVVCDGDGDGDDSAAVVDAADADADAATATGYTAAASGAGYCVEMGISPVGLLGGMSEVVYVP